MTSKATSDSFYWQTARDSLLTEAALNMFQVALRHEGEDFDRAKDIIDREYEEARGREEAQRHGGNFATFIRVFEEAGWMYLEEDRGRRVIRVTPAGHQAKALLIKTPDLLKIVPHFITELLARYQLNNPAGPETIRNESIREEMSRSNIFPYYTIWKIMRGCDNTLTTEELRRFVFRLQRREDVDKVIAQIRSYRRDVKLGRSEDELNKKYPPPITGAVGEPKYIMGRAGKHIGKHPPLITKPKANTYVLNDVYLPLIDEVLSNEPVYKDYIDADTWFRDYGKPVLIEEEYVPFSLDINNPDAKLNYQEVPDDDPVWQQVRDLVNINARNILFVGPPGTSKTTYALAIGAKLAEYNPKRFHNIQLHQSYGYDDFVEGYVPNEKPERLAPFYLKDKVFLRACAQAQRDDPANLHVLVVDEINRGDPSRIFGEAMTYIERRDEPFELPYSGRRVLVPSNLVLLSTMNPYDKSIADLDQAMDRRFEKITMDPSGEILRRILVDINQMDTALAGRIVGFFNSLSREVENRIGHAYFKGARDLNSFRKVWEHKILPLLNKELRYDQERRQKLITLYADTFGALDT